MCDGHYVTGCRKGWTTGSSSAGCSRRRSSMRSRHGSQRCLFPQPSSLLQVRTAPNHAQMLWKCRVANARLNVLERCQLVAGTSMRDDATRNYSRTLPAACSRMRLQIPSRTVSGGTPCYRWRRFGSDWRTNTRTPRRHSPNRVQANSPSCNSNSRSSPRTKTSLRGAAFFRAEGDCASLAASCVDARAIHQPPI
jgi:hypothetical protein